MVVVAAGEALATAVGVLRTGEGVEVATEVGDGVAAVFVGVGVGVVTFVGVEVGVEVAVGDGVAEVVGVGDGVEVEEAVVVGVGEGLSSKTRAYFVAEFAANVARAALIWILVTTAIAPIDENSNIRMDSTPTSILFGVCVVTLALSERCFLPESASRLFFIFVSLD